MLEEQLFITPLLAVAPRRKNPESRSSGDIFVKALNEFLAKPIWSVLIGAGIGTAVTWLAAWWYYRKAGTELREEAARLRKSTDLVLYCLINRDAKVTANYDASGHVSGLTVSASAVAHSRSEAQGVGSAQ